MIMPHNKLYQFHKSAVYQRICKGWAGEANRAKTANGRENLAGLFQSDIVRAGVHYGIRPQPAGTAN